MKSRDVIVEKLRSIKPELISRYPIGSIALFGSVARGDSKDSSDVDILIEFNGRIGMRIFEVAYELENFLHRKVDLISRNAVKPKYFREIEQDLIYV